MDAVYKFVLEFDMAGKRADSFRIALDTLREELRTGAHLAGARLTANDIAARLALSQTPVREALWRLAGEGLLLERRGQGFFVPRLQDHDLALLFRLQRDLLTIAWDDRRDAGPEPPRGRVITPLPDAPTAADPVLASERLFRALAVASSPALGLHLSRLQDQLAPIRRIEERVLDETSPELMTLSKALAGQDADGVRALLEAYFERRIRCAPLLARAYETSQNIDSI